MSTTDHKVTGIEFLVCADIARRQELGIHKYGRTVADNPLPLRSWLQHAYEEALDLAIYLRRSMACIGAGVNVSAMRVQWSSLQKPALLYACPVGEQLPDADADVLIWDSSSPIAQLGALIGDEQGRPQWVDAQGQAVEGVTHWAPLPELQAVA
jgi:hypothetical protein